MASSVKTCDMQPSMTTKPSKRKSYSYTVKEKLNVIRRIQDGESKAAVARSVDVPESTIRGWYRNRFKIAREDNSLEPLRSMVPCQVKLYPKPLDLSPRRSIPDSPVDLCGNHQVQIPESPTAEGSEIQEMVMLSMYKRMLIENCWTNLLMLHQCQQIESQQLDLTSADGIMCSSVEKVPEDCEDDVDDEGNEAEALQNRFLIEEDDGSKEEGLDSEDVSSSLSETVECADEEVSKCSEDSTTIFNMKTGEDDRLSRED